MKLVANLGLFLLFVYWTYQLIFTSSQWIFLDYANLVIHETGHLIFMLFPQIIYLLAGSFFQILVPWIALGYFLITHQKLASIFSVFWVGNNFINVSHYIKDAQNMYLPLAFGAQIHDWNWILTDLKLLKYDQIIVNLFFVPGLVCVFLSLFLLIINFKNELVQTAD
jgi:hypothetical protein